MPQRKPVNPFYVLLVIAGVAFFVTASTYGVMTVKGLYPEAGNETGNRYSSIKDSNLLTWFDKNGFQLLMIELIVLAICTFAAIGTDSYWSRRDAKSSTHNDPPDRNANAPANDTGES